MPVNRGEETWSNNRYYEDAAQNDWFMLGGSRASFSKWKSDVEPTAKAEQVAYSNPDRIDHDLPPSIGGTASLAAFMSSARKQAEGNWRTATTRRSGSSTTSARASTRPPSASPPAVASRRPRPRRRRGWWSRRRASTCPRAAARRSRQAGGPAGGGRAGRRRALAGGDGDLTTAAATLTFTPGNWDVAQTVERRRRGGRRHDERHGVVHGLLGRPGDEVRHGHRGRQRRAADPVTLRAAADTYVRDGTTYGGTNFGTATELHRQAGRPSAGTASRSSASTCRPCRPSARRSSACSASSRTPRQRERRRSRCTARRTRPGPRPRPPGTTARPPGPPRTAIGHGGRGTTGKWYEIDVTSFLAGREGGGPRPRSRSCSDADRRQRINDVFDSDESDEPPAARRDARRGRARSRRADLVVSTTSLASPRAAPPRSR